MRPHLTSKLLAMTIPLYLSCQQSYMPATESVYQTCKLPSDGSPLAIITNKGGPYSGKVPLDIAVTGIDSYDTDDTCNQSCLDYQWTLNFPQGFAANNLPEFYTTIKEPGTYELSLRITDRDRKADIALIIINAWGP
jgi:hypothetical protein